MGDFSVPVTFENEALHATLGLRHKDTSLCEPHDSTTDKVPAVDAGGFDQPDRGQPLGG